MSASTIKKKRNILTKSEAFLYKKIIKKSILGEGGGESPIWLLAQNPSKNDEDRMFFFKDWKVKAPIC